MPVRVRTLPAPEWSGVPDDVVQKFAAFMAVDAQRRLRLEPDHIQTEMRTAEHELSRYRERKDRYDREVKPLRTKLHQLERQLTARARKNDVFLEEQIEQIYALPFVTGTRVNATGRLVVQMRLQVTQLGRVRDMGDFELAFEANVNRQRDRLIRSRYEMKCIRLTADNYENIEGLESSYEEYENVSSGTITFTEAKDRIAIWDFVGIVQMVYDQLMEDNGPDNFGEDDAADFPVLVGNPEMIWEDFTANPVKALRRSIELHETTVEYKLALAKSNLKTVEDSLNEVREAIREWDTKLRTARAAYEARTVEGGNTIVIQFEDVVEIIASIMRFPGVMGMRFDNDGMPVIHVRSSLAYHDKRYDGDDFELRLEESMEYRGSSGIKTRRTRQGEIEGRFYYHPNREHSWFCYGDRSRELNRLLQGGLYAEVIHLAINSLNSVNREDQAKDHIARYHAQIPKGLVWRSNVQIAPVEPEEVAA
ncbi:MAG: hypothetical protein JWM52_692 [Candidatus Saccharibacteria bacterium]|nr:hypothetical protein [Candidatus Saccharibacteria bacterium]